MLLDLLDYIYPCRSEILQCCIFSTYGYIYNNIYITKHVISLYFFNLLDSRNLNYPAHVRWINFVSNEPFSQILPFIWRTSINRQPRFCVLVFTFFQFSGNFLFKINHYYFSVRGNISCHKNINIYPTKEICSVISIVHIADPNHYPRIHRSIACVYNLLISTRIPHPTHS